MKNRSMAFVFFLATGLSTWSEEVFSAMSLQIKEPGFLGTPGFYQKEVMVLGIPVHGSQKVSDAALRRAAEVVYAMLANDELRKRMVQNQARVEILA